MISLPRRSWHSIDCQEAVILRSTALEGTSERCRVLPIPVGSRPSRRQAGVWVKSWIRWENRCWTGNFPSSARSSHVPALRYGWQWSVGHNRAGRDYKSNDGSCRVHRLGCVWTATGMFNYFSLNISWPCMDLHCNRSFPCPGSRLLCAYTLDFLLNWTDPARDDDWDWLRCGRNSFLGRVATRWNDDNPITGTSRSGQHAEGGRDTCVAIEAL